jgi:hypothetical protein
MARPPRSSGRSRWTRLFVYAAACIAAGALAVGVVLAALDGGEERVELPPVAQPDLASASQTAGCRLALAEDDRPQEPPSEGAAAAAAPPGVYDEAPPREALVGALREGKVVISHDLEVPGEVKGELEALQALVPEGVLVVPNEGMAVELAASAWRRVVLCPRANGASTDAVRLFQGRFLGARP